MTLQKILMLLLQVSIMLTVLGCALRCSWQDATFMFRHPGKLLRAVLAMLVIMPILVTFVVTHLESRTAVAIGLVALSLSPVPPMLPKKLVQAGGEVRYVAGLLVAMSLTAIVTVPLSIMVLNAIFSRQEDVGIDDIGKILGMSVLIPAAVGIAIRHIFPASERVAPWVMRVGTIMLAVGSIALLVGAWDAVRDVTTVRMVVGMIAMAAVGLAVGHLLGGPDPGNRTALAISTASRHPAVALAVATSGPLADKPAELGIILVYLVVATLVSLPYQKWRTRAAAPTD